MVSVYLYRKPARTLSVNARHAVELTRSSTIYYVSNRFAMLARTRAQGKQLESAATLHC